MVNALNQQHLAIIVLKNILKIELNELSFVDVVEVCRHKLVVVVDRLKHVVKSFDYLQVGLFESLIKLNQSYGRLNVLIILVLLFDVVKVIEDLKILHLLAVAQHTLGVERL